jgi:hypothetical protein
MAEWFLKIKPEGMGIPADNGSRDDVEHVVVGFFWKLVPIYQQLPEISVAWLSPKLLDEWNDSPLTPNVEGHYQSYG